MKIYLLGLLLLTTSVFAQRENTLSGDCVKIGSNGSCITQTEFNSLSGVIDPIQDQLDGKVATDTDQNIADVKTFEGKIVASSTTNGFAPCPSMTETQRNAIVSPVAGDCVYNSTTTTFNVYNGSAWKSAGGGVNKWATSTSYQVDDVIIQSNKFYICLIAHTSGTFATDLAASRWLIISNDVSDSTGVLPMANGGTDKNLTPVLGGVVYTDAGSMEVLGAGTSGQILQSNGAAAPSFVNKSIKGKTQTGSVVNIEELQLPNEQLTLTATGKYRAETGNNNLVDDPSFEGSAIGSTWTVSSTGPAAQILAEPSSNSGGAPEFGLQHARFRCDGTSGGAGTCTFTKDVLTKSTSQGLAYIRISAEQGSVVKVYSGSNGTTDLTRVLTVDSSRSTPRWDGLYKIPVLLGSTSTRIEVRITVTSIESPFVLADDAFVGAVDLKTDVDQSRIAGESYFLATASCQWTRTSATVGAFSTSSTCPGPTIVNSSMGTWLTTDSDLPRQTITSLPAGRYKAKFYFFNTISVAGNTSFSINDGTTTCEPVAGNAASANGVGQVVECSFIYTTAGDRVFELYAGSAANTVNVFNSVTAPRISTKFILEYFGSGQIYSASCGANCVEVLDANFNSSGTTSSESYGIDWINGNASYSSPSFTINFNSGIFTVAPKCWAGVVNATNGYTSNIHTEATTSQVKVYTGQSTSPAASEFKLFCRKSGADLVATRTIVGSFNEVPTTRGSNGVDIQKVYFGSGANCATACSAGTCSICGPRVGNKITSVTFVSTSTYDVNGIDGTKYTCSGTAFTGGNYGVLINDLANGTSSKVRILSGNGASSANAAYADLTCMGIP